MEKLTKEEQAQWARDYAIRHYQQQEERYYERFIYYLNQGCDQLEAKHAAVVDLQDYYEDCLSVMNMERRRLDDYCHHGGYALKGLKGTGW